MSEQLEKDVQRIKASMDRMSSKAKAEGTAFASKVISSFADLIESLEKSTLPPTQDESQKK